MNCNPFWQVLIKTEAGRSWTNVARNGAGNRKKLEQILEQGFTLVKAGDRVKLASVTRADLFRADKELKNEPVFQKIITASAGTENLSPCPGIHSHHSDFYGKHQDFSLTTSWCLPSPKGHREIRERINSHLELLCNDKPATEEIAKDRSGLLDSLWPEREGAELTDQDLELLNRALRALSSDRRQLQVMTIDAYINSVFRNIVRPLRSIENFEIDIKAVEKRLPFLLQHLMKPEFKVRLDSLLSRKISPSLDEYKHFFKSLIEQRWLHFQIKKAENKTPAEGTLWWMFRDGGAEEPERLTRPSGKSGTIDYPYGAEQARPDSGRVRCAKVPFLISPVSR